MLMVLMALSSNNFNQGEKIMLTSICCDAEPYFELGYVHGVKVNKEGAYTGVCSYCKEWSEFEEEFIPNTDPSQIDNTGTGRMQ